MTPPKRPTAMRTSKINQLETHLQYTFRHRDLLTHALTHRSFSGEVPDDIPDNQRLEFLGDAVFGMLTADWLYTHCTHWREGTMTKVRSRLTNTNALAAIAEKLGVGDCLLLGQGEERAGGRQKTGILADALEALMGAIWLDGGEEASRRVFAQIFQESIQQALDAGDEENPKGELQETLQKMWKTAPTYRVTSATGPAHLKQFEVEVLLGERILARGTGASKQAAECAAARTALAQLGCDDESTPPASD